MIRLRPELRVEALALGNLGAWADLFERAASPCFCRWWHFGGTKNEWLARCAFDRAANLREMEAALAEGDPSALGLLALEDGAALGWMKVAPRSSLPKLRGLPIYRALDLRPDAPGVVWSLGCFLVDPAHRRRGIAARLLDAAPSFVQARGGEVLEAYPRHLHETSSSSLHDEEALMGPEALFVSRGFVPSDAKAMEMYPVYRRSLV